MKSVVVDPKAYDWEDDHQLSQPYASTVIYELHVDSFTCRPNSGVSEEKRGTYLGLIEKIPYLKSLGVTAVELLPVQQYDPQDAPDDLTNYWGYSPVALFAPHAGYASGETPLAAVNEFRDMIKAFHQAGIEVILDVVFNHTAEGDEKGPTLSFRGFGNRAYYILSEDNIHYRNFSGTGNTINANHSIVRRLIIDCLCYWYSEMHVDGFRFDLASIMARDEDGEPLENPPVLWSIESHPVLAGTKIIAEAWDAAGLYQVGNFIGHRWAEWNGKFRDDVRRFVRGDCRAVRPLSNRICASPDLYEQPSREPNRSINFITCHDGFTLNDLVSYNRKHNEINLHDNEDGTNYNFSWNCGVEGPTDDSAVKELRRRQIRNLMTILFVSQGTPMILMGDEVRRTQQGNNNAYNQDNEISWFNWESLEHHKDFLRFVHLLITFTQKLDVFRERVFWSTEPNPEHTKVIWHGVRLNHPDWGECSHSLAFELRNPDYGEHLHIMLNAYKEPLEFELPALNPVSEQDWCRVVDTQYTSPEDILMPEDAPSIQESSYVVESWSVVVLFARHRKT
jgi:glycogen operon protein